ncbi:MAG TPA: xylulose 5-phosphate 3-epimerase [Petrotoga sp.]|nr:xylulose 5-phosphate 3-epimerase [Petrotoga sp.]
MKKGINIWSFDFALPLSKKINIAKETGFDGIELSLDEEGEINLKSSEKDLLKIKQLAKDYNIQIPSIASGLYWKYSLTSNDHSIRQKAKDIVKKQLEVASILGADTILVIPGIVGADFVPNCEIVEYEVTYERALEAFLELKVDAEKFKVNIGLENVWNKFLLSPLEMRDFIDKVNSPYVGVYLDVGNVIYMGYPEHWVKILDKRIKKVHLKDFKRSIGNLNGFVDLLAGDVNFPKVIDNLESIGYDSYLTAEMNPYKYYGDQIVYNTSKVMDRILKYKQ